MIEDVLRPNTHKYWKRFTLKQTELKLHFKLKWHVIFVDISFKLNGFGLLFSTQHWKLLFFFSVYLPRKLCLWTGITTDSNNIKLTNSSLVYMVPLHRHKLSCIIRLHYRVLSGYRTYVHLGWIMSKWKHGYSQNNYSFGKFLMFHLLCNEIFPVFVSQGIFNVYYARCLKWNVSRAFGAFFDLYYNSLRAL